MSTTEVPTNATRDTSVGGVSGPAPDHASSRSLATFSDPDTHGRHEKHTGQADPSWPEWYAAYIVAEHAADELPS